jgi:hypothetical protein
MAIPSRDGFSHRRFTKAGRHAVNVGGSVHLQSNDAVFLLPTSANGQLDARNGPIPANIEHLFSPEPV